MQGYEPDFADPWEFLPNQYIIWLYKIIMGQTHEVGMMNISGGILWKWKDDAITAKWYIFGEGESHINIL